MGEAPGKNEDLQGKPFVGAAGKFLDELLEEAGLKREEVFIANVLKCRPPSNRNPQADEIEACAPFLREQTQSIDPWIIVTMGNFATQFILRTGTELLDCEGRCNKQGALWCFLYFILLQRFMTVRSEMCSLKISDRWVRSCVLEWPRNKTKRLRRITERL